MSERTMIAMMVDNGGRSKEEDENIKNKAEGKVYFGHRGKRMAEWMEKKREKKRNEGKLRSLKILKNEEILKGNTKSWNASVVRIFLLLTFLQLALRCVHVIRDSLECL